MKKLSAISLVLVGIVLGCGVAATVPKSFAAPEVGKWACYSDVDSQNPYYEWKESANMNKFGPHEAAGTLFAIPSASPVVCFKN